MDLFQGLKTTECTICLFPLVDEEGEEGPPPAEEPIKNHSPAKKRVKRRTQRLSSRTSEVQVDPHDEVIDVGTTISTLSGTGIVRFAPGVQPPNLSAVPSILHSDDPSSGEKFSNIVLLPCGHLFHLVCFVQLAEYATDNLSSCPVCRTKTDINDAVKLRLQSRPTQSQRLQLLENSGVEKGQCEDEEVSVVVEESNTSRAQSTLQKRMKESTAEAEKKDVETAAEVEEQPLVVETYQAEEQKDKREEILLVKEKNVGAAEAYRALLQRNTASNRKRLATLQSRNGPLFEEQQQMEDEVKFLRKSLEGAERRMKLLAGSHTKTEWAALHNSASELKFSLDCCMAELATTLRNNEELEQKIKHIEQRIKNLLEQYSIAKKKRPRSGEVG